jgi:hypothetical protein
MKKVHLLLIIACSLLTLTNCKKQIPGPKGDKGDPGPGNTIVYKSEPFSILSTAWTANYDSTGQFVEYWTTNVFSEKITSEVVSSGMVRVLIKENESWWELPYMVDHEIMTTYGFELNLIRFKNYSLHGLPPRPPSNTYRYMIITPSSS